MMKAARTSVVLSAAVIAVAAAVAPARNGCAPGTAAAVTSDAESDSAACSTNLLQVASTPSSAGAIPKSDPKPPRDGGMASEHARSALSRDSAVAPAPATKRHAKASFVGVQSEGNRTAGRAVMHSGAAVGTVYGPEGTCGKFTGGTCITGPCDDSRNAVCSSGVCTCADYTCSSDRGVCEFSVSEVASAIASGVTNVAEQLSAVAGAVPGVSTAISSISGTAGALGAVIGETTGLKSGCDQWASSCVMSACPSSISLTSDCSYGLCMCKENFCYSAWEGQPYCTIDTKKVQDLVASVSR